jgi:hypothetical protein
MRIILFEIRYYLAFLILTSSLFLGLVFNPLDSKNIQEDIPLNEVVRSKIDLDNLSNIKSIDNESSNRTHLIFIEKNNTLISLLNSAGLSNKYIKALIKAKGSEKMANIREGDILEIEITRDQIPKSIFLSSNGLNGLEAKFKDGFFKIK